MLRLSRSSRCPLIRHAWKRGLEELPVNRVEDEGQHDGTPLINPTIIGRLLFQDVFVGPPKWFRVPGKGAPQRTYRHQAGGMRHKEIDAYADSVSEEAVARGHPALDAVLERYNATDAENPTGPITDTIGLLGVSPTHDPSAASAGPKATKESPHPRVSG